MLTTVSVPNEARSIAETKAAQEGIPVSDWLTAAVARHASNQVEQLEEFPFDDCGFPVFVPAEEQVTSEAQRPR